MLAYLFWHIPNEGTDPEAYEDRLRAFHASLSRERPEGFLESAVFRHYALPWAPPSLFVYEDWYVIDSFAALGRLNDAAAAPRRAEHDAAAQMSGWGAGGVYAPRAEAALAGGFTYWLSKPGGMEYDVFYDEVGPAAASRFWRRQMVLGPAPEFCLLAESRMEIDRADVFESSSHTVYRS